MTRFSRFFPHSRLITEEQAHVQRVESSWGKSLRLRRRLYLDLFHWQIWIHVGHSSDGISQSLHATTTTHCQQSYNQTKPLSIIWTSPSCWQHNRAQQKYSLRSQHAYISPRSSISEALYYKCTQSHPVSVKFTGSIYCRNEDASPVNVAAAVLLLVVWSHHCVSGTAISSRPIYSAAFAAFSHTS